MSYLGLKENEQERTEDHQRILNYVLAGQVTVEPLMEVYLVHTLLRYYLSEDCFEQAQWLVDECFNRMKVLLTTDLELHAMLLSKQALLSGKWSDYAKAQDCPEEARKRREQAIENYQQSIRLIRTLEQDARVAPLQKRTLKKKLASFLNSLSYHLNRVKRFEEALPAAEQSVELQEEGYANFGLLAASYGELSQILAELGRFRDALSFDEKARVEIQRCANTGDRWSQEEVPIYFVNQGRLRLRLGHAEEAERLLEEARSQIHDRRKIYRIFAKEALMEIEQMRHSAHPHQLDWRWVDRYRELDAYDAYWWWAYTGPFTADEQQQWDQSFSSSIDEATKNHLGALLVNARDRELETALTEYREPCLHYPALDIAEVRRRIAGMLQLDAEIQQDEPNVLVRRLYHGTIEDEICFLRMIEATHEGNNERFWVLNQQLNPLPTLEEMQFALTRVKQAIIEGLYSPDTADVSRQVIQVIQERWNLSLDLLPGGEAFQHTNGNGPTSASSAQQTISAQAAKRFFEAVFQDGGFEGWQVALDPNSNGARIDSALRTLFLQSSPMSLETIRDYFAHEILGHVQRSLAGECSQLGLLGINTKGYAPTEEGLAQYYERILTEKRGEAFNDSGTWFGALAIGLASGVMTPPQTFSGLYAFFQPFILLRRLLWHYDEDRHIAEQRAHKRALTRSIMTFRGVPDLSYVGICYTRDVVYLRGRLKIEQAVRQDEAVLDRLAVGKVALDLLPYLQELGITTPIRPIRKYASDQDLDSYIRSFEDFKG
jgi:tetratricopeptide (TPR) repeat protein